MATDSVGAQSCGLKKRLNEIASKLLGGTVAPLPLAYDLEILARFGFLTAVEVTSRGSDAIVVIALSSADDGSAAFDGLSLTTGSAHALAADAAVSTCESSTVPAAK